jgi:hypothetical protein
VGAVGDVGRLQRGLHVRLGLEASHVLLRVLLLQAGYLGLDVGKFLVMVRLRSRAFDSDDGLLVAQTERPS